MCRADKVKHQIEWLTCAAREVLKRKVRYQIIVHEIL